MKGALLSSSLDTAENVSAYAENAFSIVPTVALTDMSPRARIVCSVRVEQTLIRA